MHLKINEHSINQLQLTEIYYSRLPVSKLAEAMSLPPYVIAAVNKMIIEDGLHTIKSNVTKTVNVPFRINNKRAEMTNSQHAKKPLPKRPVIEKYEKHSQQKNQLATRVESPTEKTTPVETTSTENNKKPDSLEYLVLAALATSKTLLMPMTICDVVKCEKTDCKATLADLMKQGLINRTLNSRYTLSQAGVDKLTKQFGFNTFSKKALKRIQYYDEFPGRLFSYQRDKNDFVDAVDSNEVGRQSDAALTEMVEDMVTTDKSEGKDPIDQELADFASSMTPTLTEIDVKIKIVKKVRGFFKGSVATHLVELEQYLTQKAG